MSQYFLLGGLIGFTAVFFLSFWSGDSIHDALRNGMIGCILCGLLVRFLCGRVLRAYMAIKLKELEELEKKKQENES
ncbi:MAG: hypothetical protein KJT03_14885 [Verrucomicrobiae bacterium]|nr:hypothetical protein [Verrucomicrobiae bacterium]